MSRRGFDYLSKLENLLKFCFWTTRGVGEQQAEDILLLLLETVPKLHCAGKLDESSDDGRLVDMSRVLNACSKPLLLRIVSVTPQLLVRPLSETVPSVSRLDLLDYQAPSTKCLGLEKVVELHFCGHISQEAMDSIVQNYSRQLKVLNILRLIDLVNIDKVAEKCSKLERLECISDVTSLADRFVNPWPCLKHLVIYPSFYERVQKIFQCAENIQSLYCNFEHIQFILYENFSPGDILFPNLVKTVLNSRLPHGGLVLKKFLLHAPRLQHLTLTDYWPESPVYRIEWLAHVPGLQVVFPEPH